LSARKIIKQGFSEQLINFALRRWKKRSISEASKLAREKYPESFKVSKKTRRKLSKSRKEYLKLHPEIKPWQRESYIEKLFEKLIEKNELAKKYDIVKEYSFFPYFIDFAFVNIKLAVETDGSQHWKVNDRIKNDREKDELLMLNDWKVYRIPSFLIKNNFEKVEQDFLQYLSLFDLQPKKFIYEQDIIKYKKLKDLKQQRHQQKKLENQKQRLLQKQQLMNKRFEDIKNVCGEFGCINKLSELWKVSHTQVSRFINNHFRDKEPYTKIIDEFFPYFVTHK